MELHFEFNHNVALFLSVVPALINLVLLIYIGAVFDRSRITFVFSLFIFSLIIWQVGDALLRISGDYSTAFTLNELFAPLSSTCTAFSFHFALLYAGEKKILRNFWIMPGIYALTFTFVALLLTPHFDNTVVQSEFFGYISSTGPDSLSQIFSLWTSVLGILSVVVLIKYSLRAKEKEVQLQSRLIIYGYAISLIQGILTEMLFPEVFGLAPFPITSSTLTLFSILTFVALIKYKLFEYSPHYMWKNIADNLSEGVLITDFNGIIRYTNKKFTTDSGLSETEIINKHILDFTITKTCKTSEKCQNEVALVSGAGEIKHMLVNCSPYQNGKGEDIGFVYLWMDVTEKKKSENILKENEEKFRSIFRAAKDAIILTDSSGKILIANESTFGLFHTTDKEIRNKRIDYLFLQGSVVGNHSKRELSKLGFKFTNFTEGTYELKGVKHNGEIFPLEVSIAEWKNESQSYFCYILRDITERKLAATHLLNAISEAQEKERERIARDIHDSLGQMLVATQLNIRALINEFEEKGDKHIDDLLPISNLLDQSIQEARNISHALMPVEIENNGFIQAVQTLMHRIQVTNGLKVNLNIDYSDGSLSHQAEINLYRIIQEFASNSIKYANAGVIDITLLTGEHNLNLLLKDDGIGFNFKEIDKNNRNGLGLKNMLSRVSVMGGISELNSSPGKGTQLSIQIPV